MVAKERTAGGWQRVPLEARNNGLRDRSRRIRECLPLLCIRRKAFNLAAGMGLRSLHSVLSEAARHGTRSPQGFRPRLQQYGESRVRRLSRAGDADASLTQSTKRAYIAAAAAQR